MSFINYNVKIHFALPPNKRTTCISNKKAVKNANTFDRSFMFQKNKLKALGEIAYKFLPSNHRLMTQ